MRSQSLRCVRSQLHCQSNRSIAFQSYHVSPLAHCSRPRYKCLFQRVSSRLDHQHHHSHVRSQTRSFVTASPFAESVTCWKCNAPVIPANALSCMQCGCTQLKALEVDYFSLFGIPQSFAISLKILDTSMKRLQKKLHPDKFARESKLIRSISSQLSSHVNSAYEILRNPLTRANYVLQLHGMSIEEGQKEQSMEVLMLVMDLREQLDEAQDTSDEKQRYDKIRSLLHTCNQHISELSDQLDTLLREDAFSEIRSLVSQLAYFYRFQEQCQACLPVT